MTSARASTTEVGSPVCDAASTESLEVELDRRDLYVNSVVGIGCRHLDRQVGPLGGQPLLHDVLPELRDPLAEALLVRRKVRVVEARVACRYDHDLHSDLL